jgi:HAD superfamily hydrolase (TIGR01509 family)
MKYIFDFDDVLFNTNHGFIEHEYIVLEKAGVSRDSIKEYYKNIKLNDGVFSMIQMLDHFSVPREFYTEIMKKNKDFVNQNLLDLIKRAGKDNCYMVTYGEHSFQMDKIKYAGIEEFFSEIIVVQGSKKDSVEKICERYKNEQILFFDDKQEHFDNLDMTKCSNLKTIHYTGQDVRSLFPL